MLVSEKRFVSISDNYISCITAYNNANADGICIYAKHELYSNNVHKYLQETSRKIFLHLCD